MERIGKKKSEAKIFLHRRVENVIFIDFVHSSIFFFFYWTLFTFGYNLKWPLAELQYLTSFFSFSWYLVLAANFAHIVWAIYLHIFRVRKIKVAMAMKLNWKLKSAQLKSRWLTSQKLFKYFIDAKCIRKNHRQSPSPLPLPEMFVQFLLFPKAVCEIDG